MAHVIDFTLFYGGVASAPVAELPFAGSSFDVQKGVGGRAVFGVPEVESVAIVKMGAVTGAVSEFGESALSYTALWEDAGGATHTASVGAFGVSTGVEIGELTAGKRAIVLGEPEAYSTCSADIDSVPEQKPAFGELAVLQAATATFDGLAYEEAFGEPDAHSVCRVDADSVSDTPAQLGVAEFYSAVTLGFASVPDVSAEAGQLLVTTASFVELDGFGRTAVLGKPSITIEAFPASVVRQPAVGAAVFISAKETAPASVPDAPAQVSGADFVSVALVRPAGMAAGSAEMGGAVTVETTALILPASVELSAAFGQPNLAVIIRPDSLVCGSVIGGVDLIPAHSADMTAVVQAAVFGGPDVGFGLIVESAGVGPRDYTFGSPAYSWRKCPRWDLLAKLQKEAEFGAEIRPAPVAAQVWRGEGCVCRSRTIEAMVARWTDLHTIAHPKNAMDAAVRRKEQI